MAPHLLHLHWFKRHVKIPGYPRSYTLFWPPLSEKRLSLQNCQPHWLLDFPLHYALKLPWQRCDGVLSLPLSNKWGMPEKLRVVGGRLFGGSIGGSDRDLAGADFNRPILRWFPSKARKYPYQWLKWSRSIYGAEIEEVRIPCQSNLDLQYTYQGVTNDGRE